MRPIDADALVEWFMPFLHEDEKIAPDAVIGDIRAFPTITPPPNDPLTLEQLRKMDGEPVWVVVENEIIMCALVETAEESVWLTNNLGGRSEYRFDEPIEDGIVIYRRKPEGE